MAKYISMFQFGCEFFGYENAIKLDNNYIKTYYEDWKRTPYSIKKYKSLLQTRG